MAKKRSRKIFARLRPGGKTRDAPLQKGHSEKRQGWKGGQGEKPQTGNRHRALQGAQERQAGTAQKEIDLRLPILFAARGVVHEPPVPKRISTALYSSRGKVRGLSTPLFLIDDAFRNLRRDCVVGSFLPAMSRREGPTASPKTQFICPGFQSPVAGYLVRLDRLRAPPGRRASRAGDPLYSFMTSWPSSTMPIMASQVLP